MLPLDRRVAALFVRAGSVYAGLGCDCYDMARDARSFDLAAPVVAHPPCRSWGRLSQRAKPRVDERDLAVWAVWVVRHCGGVLEHPMSSRLWQFFGIRPGVRDQFGGLLVPVHQSAYGHRAPKLTGLYLVGCQLRPELHWGEAARGRVELMCRAERERTPVLMAEQLIELARSACVG